MIRGGVAVGPASALELQRLVGNRAFGEVVAGRPAVVQRKNIRFSTEKYGTKHQTEYQDYLDQVVARAKEEGGKKVFPEPVPYGKPYDKARAAAILLDHDVNERRPVGEGDLLDELRRKVRRSKHVEDLWNETPQVLLDLYWGYVKSLSSDKSALSVITWGPMNEHGAGTSVTADLRPDGHPKGSPAGGWNPWAIQLSRRADKTKSLYARGHLLNRHLGGPGLDYNMAPLTSRAGWFGANDANQLHSGLAERQVKGKFDRMRHEGGDRVRALHYEVEAEPRPPRDLTAVVRKSTDDFLGRVWSDIVEPVGLWRVGGVWREIDSLRSDELDEIWLALNKKHELGPLKRNRRHFDDAAVRSYLRFELRVKPSLVKMGEWERNDRELLRALWDTEVPNAEPLIRAVTADRTGTSCGERVADLTWDELRTRMKANAALWEYEDRVVPARLVVSWHYEQYGVKQAVPARDVPVDLPSELDTPFWPVERKSMLND